MEAAAFARPRRGRPTLFRLLAVIFLCLPGGLLASGSDWDLGDFKVNVGQGQYSAEGWLLSPDAEGKIYLTMDLSAADLSESHMLQYSAQTHAAVQYYLLWRTQAHGDKLFQYRIPAPAAGNVPRLLDMQGKPHWEGQATMIGIGVFSPGGRDVRLRTFSLEKPGLAFEAQTLLDEWTSYLPRQAIDINLYTGTREVRRGISPVAVFGLLLAAALAGYLLCLLLRGRLATPDWRIVGGLVLLAWLGLDTLWQLRLGKQVLATLPLRELSVEERLLASADGPIVQLVGNILPFIKEKNARVLLVSDSEASGMLGSYYLSPLNTHLPQVGQDLHTPMFVRSGDYLLVIRPSRVDYDSAGRMLKMVNGGNLPVEQLYSDGRGSLYRAI